MDAQEQLRQMITGYRVSAAIHAAAELGLSDLLAGGPLTVAELATAADCHPRSLGRLLSALATVGVYERQPDGRFGSTELGDQLRGDSAGNQRALSVFIGRPYFWQSWSGLTDSVRTGENATRTIHGEDMWSYRASRPEESAIFDAAMTAMSLKVAGAVLGAYDFGRFGCVVDVGGGRGAMLGAILAANPDQRGILFDQPHVVAGAPDILAAAGVHSRCEVVGGDMFVEVPTGGDAYLLKAILHDWADAESAAILTRCRAAMSPDATLIIIERLLEVANPEVAFSDLNMLVGPGGQERSTDEYAELLSQAGFRLTRTIPTTGPMFLIEAAVTSG